MAAQALAGRAGGVISCSGYEAAAGASFELIFRDDNTDKSQGIMLVNGSSAGLDGHGGIDGRLKRDLGNASDSAAPLYFFSLPFSHFSLHPLNPQP